MEDALYYKCGDCGYEILAKIGHQACPRCKGNKLEGKDMKSLPGMDE